MPSQPSRSFLLCALIFIGWTAFASDPKSCQPPKSVTDPAAVNCLRAFCEAKTKCQAARSAADANVSSLAGSATAATAGKNVVKNNADTNKSTNSAASSALQVGLKECTAIKPDCQSKCQIGAVKPEFKAMVKKEQASCNAAIDKNIADLGKAAGETSRLAGESGKTGDASDGKSESNPMSQMPQPPQSGGGDSGNSDSPAADSQPSESSSADNQAAQDSATEDAFAQGTKKDLCAGDNANLYAQCKSESAVTSASAACARFKQQCGKDTNACLRNMAAAERQAIETECLGQSDGVAESESGYSPKSIAGGTAPAAGGGGGGGTGGAMNATGGAKLDPLEGMTVQGSVIEMPSLLNDKMSAGGEGGYSSGGGSGSTGGDSYDPFARAPSAESGGKSSSSALTIPVSNAKDVAQRFTPNVFKVHSDVYQSRCARGKSNNCGPNGKK